MKVICIGTSNSVMGNDGFLKSLRHDFDVTNMSLGRVSIHYHIKTVLDNIDLIEQHDLLIVDHYINDANFYHRACGELYISYLDEFYAILSALNVNVLNLIFPIRGLHSDKMLQQAYFEAVAHCRTYGVSLLDLNAVKFDDWHYLDKIHLHKDVSYMLGIELARSFKRGTFADRPSGGKILACPYRTVKARDFSGKNKTASFKNSLVDVVYCNIVDRILVPAKTSEQLLSIGYVRLKEMSGGGAVVINGNARSLADTGHFHEMLDFDVHGNVTVAPYKGESLKLGALMKRGTPPGPYTSCFITDFLFRDSDIDLETRPASRTMSEITLPNILEMAERVRPKSRGALSPLTVDHLRDLSLDLEKQSLTSALEVMEIALEARPGGPLIKQKVADYRARIKSKPSGK